MPRWIIPAGVVAILVSLAALGILLATNASGPSSSDLQDDAQVEPEIPPQPTPEPETPEEELTVPEDPAGAEEEEQPLQREQTTGDEPDAQQSPLAPGPRSAVVRITGGAAYYCSVGVIGEPETIQGRRPASYEVGVSTGGTSLETVMAACQKISPGTLGVRIIYDGEVVAREETDVRLGTVSVSWNPLEE